MAPGVTLGADVTSDITEQNYGRIAGRIRGYIGQRIAEARADGLVLGLSGGIDSAVLAYLCRTDGLLEKTLAIMMPDTTVTPESETADAQRIISILGMKHKLIDIAPILREYSMYLEPNENARANLAARVRANILYYYANAKNLLVLGSSDRSEHLIGYFTKYGDGASDVAPIVSLYKLQVRGLARHLGVPDAIIQKKSSPFLRKGDEAEAEIGATYEEIDSVLWCAIEKGMPAEAAAEAARVDVARARDILGMNRSSSHKRGPPAREDLGQAYDVR